MRLNALGASVQSLSEVAAGGGFIEDAPLKKVVDGRFGVGI
jgi:hypothetical protein